ncbi:MAG: helix-turn-helix domain-containing protein [Pseudomonadota bacterium]
MDILAGIRILAISQVILAVGFFLYLPNARQTRIAITCIGFGVISYLALPIVYADFDRVIVETMTLASNLVPVLLVYIVWIVFEDLRAPTRWMRVSGLSYLALCLVDTASQQSGIHLDGCHSPIVLQIAKAIMVLYAAHIIWRGRDTDLVYSRLSLRRLFTYGLAGAVGLVVFVELIFSFDVPPILEYLGVAGIFILAFAINLRAVHFAPNLARPRDPVDVNAPSNPLVAAISAKMEKEHRYRDPELRIAGLSEELGIPEHRLRGAIRSELGFRNFNQFLNQYRVREAAERLLKEPSMPITQIAFEIGFASLSTFNAAFKEAYQCAPSSFRKNEPREPGLD